MFKDYSEAQSYLEQFIPQPKVAHQPYQLERMQKLCRLLGDPQTTYPIIHITGTSGKGSTATFCAAILTELGLTTGLHTSPHLQMITERLQIDNQPIPLIKFLTLINKIRPVIETLTNNPRFGAPTYFEILVALSFLYFKEMRIDAAVIEVGLGGKLDATNIILPATVVLTNISLDHTRILGKTVAKICADKMGVIKKGAPAVVSGVTQQKLKQMLISSCRELKVPLYLMGRDFKLQKRALRALGDFQTVNFTLAGQAVKLFLQQHFPQVLPKLDQAVESAAKTVFIPGRLEKVSDTPLIILDGAHNRAKITALTSSLKHMYPKQRWVSVVAVKTGKPYPAIIRHLTPITSQFVFTQFSQSTDTGLLQAIPAKIFLKFAPFAIIEPDPAKAIRLAQKLAGNQGAVLITGSLYLVGEVRRLWHPVRFK